MLTEYNIRSLLSGFLTIANMPSLSRLTMDIDLGREITINSMRNYSSEYVDLESLSDLSLTANGITTPFTYSADGDLLNKINLINFPRINSLKMDISLYPNLHLESIFILDDFTSRYFQP